MPTNPNPGKISGPMWMLWVNCPNPSWKLGGFYADKPHYHSSVNENLAKWPMSYSVRLRLDLVPYNRQYSRAIDLTMSDSEMIKWTKNMRDSALDPDDPRLGAVKEFYGTLDGKTVFGLSKDTVNGKWRESSAGITHLWHGHVSIFTAFVNSWAMLSPLISVWRGESFYDWRRQSMQMSIAQVGDTGEVVRYWQQVHNKVRGSVSPASPLIKVDGDYGDATAAAFLDFWRKSGGTGDSYKGTYITGWLALQYHMALSAFASVADVPHVNEQQLKVMVNDWLSKNIPTNLIITGDVNGRITIP